MGAECANTATQAAGIRAAYVGEQRYFAQHAIAGNIVGRRQHTAGFDAHVDGLEHGSQASCWCAQ
jgi:hypothetical protein